jgi:CheY-like chemotaxis protein
VNPGNPAAGCRIVVADDNTDAGDALQMLLEIQGHEVQVARDGRAAVEVAETFRPDIMLLDLGMPVMDGYATAAAIRSKDWGNTIHLVALTGYSQPADRERATQAGFDVFLVKPVEFDALEKICARAVTER